MEIVATYDRSGLIERAVRNLSDKLVEEFLVVALVCFAVPVAPALGAGRDRHAAARHARWRSSSCSYQGINANIMSLGGIAIAIGAMVDAAVVMIENAHKQLEHWRERHPGRDRTAAEHWRADHARRACEVGPALFFSLLIITLSFVPIFTLQAQEGRLFSPLAYTKTYAMAAAAGWRSRWFRC